MGYTIGIDTGGTYTDAVIYDTLTRQVLCSSKVLTVRDNLSIGILEALDGLDSHLCMQAQAVCLSTTLATNACVENKGARSKLLFIGVNPKAVEWVGNESGLDDPSLILYAPGSLGQDSSSWSAFLEEHADWFSDAQALGIVDLNTFKNHGIAEKAARCAILQRWNIPAVCGYTLADQLNSIHRGASALLNGRLIPILCDFLGAIRKALDLRHIHAPIAIMGSDGTLLSVSFTEEHPVETILCGPAASVAGGVACTEEPDAVVVDMGGTTTDLALIRDGIPVKARNGIRIGPWHTAIEGVLVHTFGLGGDSAIRISKEKGRLQLCSDRVIPLCVAASRWPYITEKLRQLDGSIYDNLITQEFWVCTKPITAPDQYTPQELLVCKALENHPLSWMELATAVNADPYFLKTDRLEREGHILRCGLTPTDIMHIRGDYTAFCAEASRLGAVFVARRADITTDELCDWVYNEVKKALFLHISQLLLEEAFPQLLKEGLSPQVKLLLTRAWEQRKANAIAQWNIGFHTPSKLIGVGAPIHIFLPEVAAALGTTCIIPPHANVVNALGAAACSITAEKTIQITEKNSTYIVWTGESPPSFKELPDALIAAKTAAEKLAEEEVRSRGAAGEILYRHEERIKEVPSGYGGMLFISAEVRVTASSGLSL